MFDKMSIKIVALIIIFMIILFVIVGAIMIANKQKNPPGRAVGINNPAPQTATNKTPSTQAPVITPSNPIVNNTTSPTPPPPPPPVTNFVPETLPPGTSFYGWWTSARNPGESFYIKRDILGADIIEGTHDATKAEISGAVIRAYETAGNLSGNKINWLNGNVWTKYSDQIIVWAGEYTSKTEPGLIFSISALGANKVSIADPYAKTTSTHDVLGDRIFAYDLVGKISNNTVINWPNGNIWTKK